MTWDFYSKPGARIAKIRNFRKLTQSELGIALGFNPTNASIRISQYESNQKLPRENVLVDMALQLDISLLHFIPGEDYATEIVQLFWEEENDLRPLQVFPVLTDQEEAKGYDLSFYGIDSRKLPNNFLCLAYPSGFNRVVKIWMEIKRQFLRKEISWEDYFEWKLKWPSQLSDDVPVRWE